MPQESKKTWVWTGVVLAAVIALLAILWAAGYMQPAAVQQ